MCTVARRFVDAESGQTLVEFALASLLFFTVLFGTIEFGLMVWRYNMLSDLAQEGARWASVRGATSFSIPYAQASKKNVEDYVKGRAVGMAVTVTTAPDAPWPPQRGQTVSVTVKTVVAPLTQLVPHGTLTLSSTASMVISR